MCRLHILTLVLIVSKALHNSDEDLSFFTVSHAQCGSHKCPGFHIQVPIPKMTKVQRNNTQVPISTVALRMYFSTLNWHLASPHRTTGSH